MNQNLVFTTLNVVFCLLSLILYYPAFTTSTTKEFQAAFPPYTFIVKNLIHKKSRSYLRTSLYLLISLVIYGVIAVSDEEDMTSAVISVVVTYAVSLVRVWKLRQLIGIPRD